MHLRKHSRIFSLLSAAALALIVTGAQAQGSAWPTKTIELVIPQGPGGGTDVLGRLWAKHVGKALGNNVVVMNKAGANGIMASSYVAKKDPDGYTILLTGVSYLAVNPAIYPSLSYDPKKDFSGVALLTSTPFMLTASTASGLKTFDEFVAAGKAATPQLTFASAGKGNSTHLVMEMLKARLGLDLLHVPYTGGRLALAVMSGEVDVAANVMNTVLAPVHNGQVNALAVIGANRSKNFPNVPTLQELGVKDFPLPGWYALVAPANTPRPIIDRINAETQKFLADPEIKKTLLELDLEPLPGPPEAVGEWVNRDSGIWGDFIRENNLQNN